MKNDILIVGVFSMNYKEIINLIDTSDIDIAISQLRSLASEKVITSEQYDFIVANYDELLGAQTMNKIKLTDLLRYGEFRHYRFLCSKDDFKEDDLWYVEDKTGINIIHFTYKEQLSVGENYDLGYCLCYGNNNNKISADYVALTLQRAKFLEFDYLECDFEERTLYIHLKRKRD